MIRWGLSIGELPALLHPPRGDRWWFEGGRLGFAARGHRWTVHDDHVIGEPEREDPRERAGRDVVVRRERGEWATAWELSEGAAASPTIQPFLRGAGVAWTADGFAYVQEQGRKPRVAGSARAGAALSAGPEGAILLGDDAAWERGAAPGGLIARLPVPLSRTGWGERWRADGAAVAGVGPDGRGVTIELTSGRVHAANALPLDADGHHLHADGRLDAPHPPGWRPLEASCARSGDLLAGPGGVVWDLARGTPLFEEPVVAFGATVATPGDWATVEWETGRGRWFDPRTGEVRGRFQLLLDPGDIVDRGWFDAITGGVRFLTGRGQVLSPDHAGPDAEPPEPLDPFAVVGGVRFEWDDDGVLLALPG